MGEGEDSVFNEQEELEMEMTELNISAGGIGATDGMHISAYILSGCAYIAYSCKLLRSSPVSVRLV